MLNSLKPSRCAELDPWISGALWFDPCSPACPDKGSHKRALSLYRFFTGISLYLGWDERIEFLVR